MIQDSLVCGDPVHRDVTVDANLGRVEFCENGVRLRSEVHKVFVRKSFCVRLAMHFYSPAIEPRKLLEVRKVLGIHTSKVETGCIVRQHTNTDAH